MLGFNHLCNIIQKINWDFSSGMPTQSKMTQASMCSIACEQPYTSFIL